MSKWLDALLACVLLALSAYRMANGGLLNILLAAQTALAAALLLVRRAPAREASWTMRVLAWLSAYLPLLMQPGVDAVVPMALQIAGLILAIWAKACLGKSFGVAPADRGLVSAGPYRWVRHPAYGGELMNFVGVLVSALTLWNAVVFMLVGLSLTLRIVVEESLIHGYSEYAAQVRWRLVPGVW